MTAAVGGKSGQVAATAAAGVVPNAADTIFYVIELDASELSDASQFVQLALANASANSVIASAVAVLSGSRYGEQASRTQIV